MVLCQQKRIPVLIHAMYAELQKAIDEYCADKALYFGGQHDKLEAMDAFWHSNHDDVSQWLCMMADIPTVCEFKVNSDEFRGGEMVIPHKTDYLIGVHYKYSGAGQCKLIVQAAHCNLFTSECTANVPYIFEYPVPLICIQDHVLTLEVVHSLANDWAPPGELTLLYAHLPYTPRKMIAQSNWLMAPGVMVVSLMVGDVREEVEFPLLPCLHDPAQKPTCRWLLGRETGV